MPQFELTNPLNGQRATVELPRAPQSESEVLYIFSHPQNAPPTTMTAPPLNLSPAAQRLAALPIMQDEAVRALVEGAVSAEPEEPPLAAPKPATPLQLFSGVTSAPAAAMMGHIADKPGDVLGGMADAGKVAFRAPVTPTAQQPTMGGELEKRGVPMGPLMKSAVDVVADPANLIGGGPEDAAKAAIIVGPKAVRGAAKFAKTLTTKASPKAVLSMMKHAEFDLPAMVQWLKELPSAAKIGRDDVLGFIDSLTKPAPTSMVPRHADTERWADTVIPALDKYSKPTGFVTKKLILKKLAETKGVPKDIRAHFTALADVVGDTPISPRHFQAMARGEAYTPPRTLRKVAAIKEGNKKIPGAPLGVSTSKQERALRDRYVKWMGEGVGGRMWYNDSGEAIKFLANDDPARASMLAEDLAVTSSATTVDANTGFGVKGYNQATAGTPVETGRFPANMAPAIRRIHEEGGTATGLKRTPFADNLARGGQFYGKDPATLRAVHDIWDGEAHGFVNPDGSPIRTGFTDAQHRWMDKQAADAVRVANEKSVGGVNDWTELEAQAATWTAAKIRAGDVKPGEEAKSYANFFKKLYAQGSRETIPGVTTGHMPEIHREPYEIHALLHDIVTKESGIYDARGRDQITAGYGGLTGGSFDAPGVFEGGVHPGKQVLTATGSVAIKDGAHAGGRQLDAGSRRLMEASEALYALLTGQDAAAGSKLLDVGKGLAKNAVDIALPDGPISVETVTKLMDKLRADGLAGQVIVVPTPDGVRVGNAGMDPATFDKVVKGFGGRVTARGQAFDENTGLYIGNEWNRPGQEVGQHYFEPALGGEGQPFAERFDKFAPGLAQKMRDVDTEFSRLTGGKFTLSPYIDEVRATIANEGAAGLNRLAKKYGISAVLLGAALQQLGLQTPSASEPVLDATASSQPEG